MTKFCNYHQCNSRAYYGFPSCKPIVCKYHKLDGMINLSAKICKHEGCTKHGSFSLTSSNSYFCKRHSLPEMVNRNIISAIRCNYPECTTKASFGIYNKAERCSIHKEEGMLYLVRKLCRHPWCYKIPNFGSEAKKPLYCATHKMTGMWNVVTKLCGHEECYKIANFGFDSGIDSGIKQFCSKHKLLGMTNLTTKRCKHKGCLRMARFGIESNKNMFCSDHRVDGMEVFNKKYKM